MEYPALGTVEATNSGGAQPYSISEDREGREPDGLRFDRERARRLWEAVSGAQPVGREEGEFQGLRGRKPLALLPVSRGVAETRGENADQPPGLWSHPLTPGPPLCVTRPGTPGLVHLIGPRQFGPALLKIEAAAPQESGPRVQIVKGIRKLRP